MSDIAIDEALSDLSDTVSARLGEKVTGSQIAFGELTISVERNAIKGVLKQLSDDARCQFEVLIDVCGVDWPAREDRFDVVYHLLSPRLNQRIRVKLTTNETEPVPSAVEIFPAADWFEREAYDMYGVRFADHPDMTRILLWEGFNGYPSRKDFPVEGIDTGSATRISSATV